MMAINAQDGEAVICPHCGGPTNVGDLDAIEVAYCIAGPDQDGCGWYEAPPGATRSGRWGIRQIDRHGNNTGGGTVGVGWASREEAEQANPSMAGFTFEPFERWSDA